MLGNQDGQVESGGLEVTAKVPAAVSASLTCYIDPTLALFGLAVPLFLLR